MATLKKKSANGRISPSLDLPTQNLTALVKVVKAGLPFARLVAFAKKSRLTFAELATSLQIPPRTLARRRGQGALTGLESERLVRLAGVFDQAVRLFEGDTTAALTWLRQPAKAFAGQSPLDMAEMEIGARAVEDLIGRLEYGVFS